MNDLSLIWRVLRVILLILGGVVLCFGADLEVDSKGGTRLLYDPVPGDFVAPDVYRKVLTDVGVVERERRVDDGGRVLSLERVDVGVVEGRLARAREDALVDAEVARVLAAVEGLEDVPEWAKHPVRVGVSASVYGVSGRWVTRFRIECEGGSCVAWSSLDFQLLAGVTQFLANGRFYVTNTGWGLVHDLKGARAAGCPEGLIGEVVKGGAVVPRFVVVKRGEGSAMAVRALGDLHELFVVERVRLLAAAEKRRVNAGMLAAWRRANPVKPREVKVRFWRKRRAGRSDGGVKRSR